MTYSILARDEETGVLGAAAATGSLCVGGWVLRGDSLRGLSASQGSAPSTLWGEAVLEEMGAGVRAMDAVARTVQSDSGRDHRQLAALDPSGGTGVFSGAQSIPVFGHRSAANVVVAGNLLSDEAVLEAALSAYQAATGPIAERLLAALDAGHGAGSDSRGLKSAALLVVGADMAPLTLRIDSHATPLAALRDLYGQSQTPPYADWLQQVPTRNDPERAAVED